MILYNKNPKYDIIKYLKKEKKMETIKKIFADLYKFNENIFGLEYLIIFASITMALFVFLKLNSKVFDYLQKKNKETQEITELEIQKLKNKQKLITLFILIVFALIFTKNFSILMSVLSIMSIMILMSAKEQVSNIIVGIVIKMPFFNTSLKEGETIHVLDLNKHPFKILKVKIFKTFLLDLNTEEVISIQNTDLISNAVFHNPVTVFDVIQFEYILDSGSFFNNEEKVGEYIKKITAEETIDYNELKKMIGYVKHQYEYFPSIKNNFKIHYEFIDSKQVRVTVKMKRFGYNYKNYNKEYVEIYKKLVEKE